MLDPVKTLKHLTVCGNFVFPTQDCECFFKVGGLISERHDSIAKFVERAPADVVAAEREKLETNGRMLETLNARLEGYL